MDEEQRTSLVDKIIGFNEGNMIQKGSDEYSTQVPVVCCEHYGWRATPMQTMLQFAQSYNQTDLKGKLSTKEHIIQQIARTGIYGPNEDFEKKEEKYMDSVKLKVLKMLKVRYEWQLCQDWQKNVNRNCRYDYPQILNKEKVNPEHAFVLPMFLKPGRNNFFVFYQGKSYYSRHLVDIRKEEIPPFIKQLKKSGEPISFNLKTSVFRKREFDDDATIKAALKHDQKSWKLFKIVNYNNSAEENITKVIHARFHMLNDIFLSLAAKSQFPTISFNDLSSFFSVVGLF